MRKTIDIVVTILSKHWKWVAAMAGLLSLTIAMFMSLNQSVWFDEGYSIIMAKRPVHELIALTSIDAHPPLYYLYLKLWGSIFGWSEIALHLSTALFGAASVVVMIAIARKLFSPKVAVVVAPFVVLAPFLARYNYEIRMYAMVGFIGLLATWVLIHARQSRTRTWWLWYAVLVAVGMYTLYMSIVIWLAHLLWLVYESRKAGKPVVTQRYWLYYGLAILLFLPWVPTVVYQLFHSALPPYMTAVTLKELSGIMSMLLSYNAAWEIGPWLTVGLLIGLGLFVSLWRPVWTAANARYKSGLLLIGLSFVTAIIFYALISLPPNTPRFMERYTVHVAIYAYAMIGIIVALGWRIGRYRQAVALGVLSVAMMVFGLATLYSVGNYNYQRLQVMQANAIRKATGCDQTTFVTSGPYGYIDMWYDMQGCDLRYYEPSDIVFTGGYAPVNSIPERIKNTDAITARRLIFVYYDDSTEFMTPDARYKKVGQQDFDKTHLVFYERN
jgi:mannosyltransferase